MTDYTKLKRLAEAAIEQESRWKAAGEPWPVWNICLLEMQAAANPAAVLALIAEVDGLHAQHGRDSGELRKLCAARDSARRQRDQLRAEVAGLKTGYEAYERVNAELKAEVEALRKDAERYRWLRDSDYAGKILRDMGAKYRADADQRIDAALGKGEQS